MPADAGRLRSAGLNDRAVPELAHVVTAFDFVSRRAGGSGVTLEAQPAREAPFAWTAD